MNRSMNIHLADDFITTEIGAKGVCETLNAMLRNDESISDGQSDVEKKIKILKLQRREGRLNKELKNIIDNITQVESAKILGQKDERIADGIIKSMTDCMTQTEVKIEQVKAELSQLTNPYDHLKKNISLSGKVQHTSVKIFKDNKAKKSYLESVINKIHVYYDKDISCLLYTSPSPRDRQKSRMPSSA